MQQKQIKFYIKKLVIIKSSTNKKTDTAKNRNRINTFIQWSIWQKTISFLVHSIKTSVTHQDHLKKNKKINPDKIQWKEIKCNITNLCTISGVSVQGIKCFRFSIRMRIIDIFMQNMKRNRWSTYWNRIFHWCCEWPINCGFNKIWWDIHWRISLTKMNNCKRSDFTVNL